MTGSELPQLAASSRGHWRFVLEEIESGTRMEVSDAELLHAPERAALLAVVRGLEALEQPSRVTLVTTSRYVARGIQFGLQEWRESEYCWEHFGSVQPIRNADLWRRIDHAMQFHQVSCRYVAGEVAEHDENHVPMREKSINSAASELSSERDEVATTAPSPRRSSPVARRDAPHRIPAPVSNGADAAATRWSMMKSRFRTGLQPYLRLLGERFGQRPVMR